MKAKIKATGEIIKIADYATIALDDHDSWGNPIEVKPEDIELMYDTTETTEDEHWRDIMERAAIAALNGTINILSNSDRSAFREIIAEGFRGNKKTYPNEIAEFAMSCANALVKLLKLNN